MIQNGSHSVVCKWALILSARSRLNFWFWFLGMFFGLHCGPGFVIVSLLKQGSYVNHVRTCSRFMSALARHGSFLAALVRLLNSARASGGPCRLFFVHTRCRRFIDMYITHCVCLLVFVSFVFRVGFGRCLAAVC